MPIPIKRPDLPALLALGVAAGVAVTTENPWRRLRAIICIGIIIGMTFAPLIITILFAILVVLGYVITGGYPVH